MEYKTFYQFIFLNFPLSFQNVCLVLLSFVLRGPGPRVGLGPGLTLAPHCLATVAVLPVNNNLNLSRF